MDYQKIYESIINRSKSRELDPSEYYERHHILPKCLGGADDSSNIAYLTAEEHYLAHQLLVKIHPGHYGLAFAATLMTRHTGTGRMNNKLFGWIRRRLSLNVPKRGPMPMAVREKVSRSKTGKKLSPESLASRREKMKGRVISPQERARRSEAARGRRHSEETKMKIGKAHTGRTFSAERRQSMSDAMKGKRLGVKRSLESVEKGAAKLRGSPKSEAHRRKLSEANLGKTHTEESRQKMSMARCGIPKAESHNQAVAASKLGTKKVQVAPGVFRMFSPGQLEHFTKTGEALTRKEYNKLYEPLPPQNC